MNEIQDGHIDGMKRAFGIITKLDLCQTRNKFVEHPQKAAYQVKGKGFLREKVYSVCAYASLLEATKTNPSLLQTIKECIVQFDELSQGFDKCKQALDQYIEFELPTSRLQQVISISQQKVIHHVKDALKLGRQLTPFDNERTVSEDYLKQVKGIQWNDIFTNERYEPTVRRAVRWQKQSLVLNRKKFTDELIDYFKKQFQERTREIMNKDHPVGEMMLEQHDIALLQMNPYRIETDERENIAANILKGVVQASNELAVYMYDKYVNKLEELLNEICPEQGNLFQSDLTLERCSIEVQTLVVRVARPIIMTLIRWPHMYKDNRLGAGRELMCIAPTIAYNIHEDNRINSSSAWNSKISVMADIIDEVLKFYMDPSTPMALVTTLFRRE